MYVCSKCTRVVSVQPCIPGELLLQRLQFPTEVNLYVSPHNPGASKLTGEIQGMFPVVSYTEDSTLFSDATAGRDTSTITAVHVAFDTGESRHYPPEAMAMFGLETGDAPRAIEHAKADGTIGDPQSSAKAPEAMRSQSATPAVVLAAALPGVRLMHPDHGVGVVTKVEWQTDPAKERLHLQHSRVTHFLLYSS